MARSKSVALDINFRTNSKNIQKLAEIAGIASAMNSNQLANCYFIVEGHTVVVSLFWPQAAIITTSGFRKKALNKSNNISSVWLVDNLTTEINLKLN